MAGLISMRPRLMRPDAVLGLIESPLVRIQYPKSTLVQLHFMPASLRRLKSTRAAILSFAAVCCMDSEAELESFHKAAALEVVELVQG